MGRPVFVTDDDIVDGDSFEIVDNEYGKTGVRMMHLRRDGLRDVIKDLEVDTSLTLDSDIEYTHVRMQ